MTSRVGGETEEPLTRWRSGALVLEATPGIEPGYRALQALA